MRSFRSTPDVKESNGRRRRRRRPKWAFRCVPSRSVRFCFYNVDPRPDPLRSDPAGGRPDFTARKFGVSAVTEITGKYRDIFKHHRLVFVADHRDEKFD